MIQILVTATPQLTKILSNRNKNTSIFKTLMQVIPNTDVLIFWLKKVPNKENPECSNFCGVL